MIRDKKSGHDLAQKTEVQRKLKRMKRGARKVAPGGGKGPVLILILSLLNMLWACFGLVNGVQMGGSLGAVKLNDALRESLPSLLKDFDIIHLCGKGHKEESLEGTKGYRQFEYVTDELADLFAVTDVIIARAGSNSISEFLALKKPHLLIPLSAKASRGDQILNAASYEKQGFAMVLPEEELTAETMETKVRELYANRETYIAAMEKSTQNNGVEAVMSLIRQF